MGAYAQFVLSCRQEHVRLQQLLAKWASQDGLLERSELALQPAPTEPFSLAKQLLDLKGVLPGITEEFKPRFIGVQTPAAAQAAADSSPGEAPAASASSAPAAPAAPAQAPLHAGEHARRKVDQLMSDLGIAIIGLHGGLLEQLSDIVFEGEMSRTLMFEGDSLQVTSVSVLGAIALANLSYCCQHHHTGSDLVELPLRAARTYSDHFRNGDLLMWNLAARSVAAARRESAFGANANRILDAYMPRFMAHSVLAKMDMAFDVPLAAMRKADYTTWPGLAALTADEGARSIRSRFVSALALRCEANPSVGLAVVGRWIQTMAKLPGVELHASLLVGRFIWEILERSEKTLSAMLRKPKESQPLLAAAASIEQWREAHVPADDARAAAWRHLRDVGSCLDQFSVYREMCEMNRLSAGSPQLSLAASTKGGAS